MRNQDINASGLKKEIGQIGYGAIALNGAIGAGIFALPAIAMEQAGLFSPWVFLICGFLAMTIVLVFARIASYFSDTGGPVTYATTAFGPFIGFQAGWLLALSRAAAFAANAHLAVIYAGWIWPALTEGVMTNVAVILVCLLLTGINVVGIRQGMLAVFALTVLKLLPLLLLVLLGISAANPDIFTSAQLPQADSLGQTALIVFYAFMGFEGAVVPAGEGKNARRDIPLALIRTILAIAVFYFLIQVVTISVAPDIAGNPTPLAEVALILMGAGGAALLTLGAIFSVAGNLAASMLSAPRMIYAMARHGTLPAWLGAVNSRFNTPANAILFYGIVSLGLALSGGFVFLAVISTAVRLLVYIMCISTLPVLDRKLGNHRGQFQLPAGNLIPALALGLCIWLMTHATLQSWLYTLGFVLVGAVLFLFTRYRADVDK